jgi:hypothetical protein
MWKLRLGWPTTPVPRIAIFIPDAPWVDLDI